MFTGIVEEQGTIAAAGARMNVKCRKVMEDTREGSSIAVNGVCLTATKVDAATFHRKLWREPIWALCGKDRA